MARKLSGSLDTNALLRLVLNDIPAQTKRVEALMSGGRQFHIADAALIEFMFVLEKLYGMDRPLIVENVSVITHNKMFICNRVLFEHALPLYIAEPKLSVIDCMLLTYARLNKATPLYSFDKDLARKSDGDCTQP